MVARHPHHILLIVALVPLMLLGCGTNSGGGGGTVGDAQGVCQGTRSNGFNLESIVLPNDKFYAFYGEATSNYFAIDGMMTGQGASGSSTYTVPIINDFFYVLEGTQDTLSLTATYVAGVSLNGTLAEPSGTNGTDAITGTAIPTSLFNYNTPASVSAISGTWTGGLQNLLELDSATVTVSANGTVSGSSSLGCSITGTVAADASNRNFFDVSLTFGDSPCGLPNQTASGIGIEYLLSDGTTNQLLVGVTTGGIFGGTVFAAAR